MIEQRTRLLRLGFSLLLAFGLVALVLGYWTILRSPTLKARDDNPRVVAAELRIRRGSILDTNSTVLAQSIGPTEDLVRRYPIPEIGPAVGYYSLRYGTTGIEASLDAVLRGETDDWRLRFGRAVLHEPQVGRDVRLTLNASWQKAATIALEGRLGAALVMSLPDGAIRVLASQPGYDPNMLDETFESLAAAEDGPLVNRVTQGTYQPGMAMQPLVMAALLADGQIRLAESAHDPNDVVPIDGGELACLTPVDDDATLADVLLASCPGPMVSLANLLTPTEWVELYERFALTGVPNLQFAVEAADGAKPVDLGRAALGQDTLVVTPLQLGIAWMVLANGGSLVQPRIVGSTVGEDDEWHAVAPVEAARQVMPVTTAQAILGALPHEQGVIEHVASALSGPEGQVHAWYLAAAPASAPSFIVVVILEDGATVEEAREVGRAVVRAVLETR